MRLLFIHNDRVKEDNEGNLYTGGCYNQQIWERYLELADEMTVLLKKEKKIYTKEEALLKFNPFGDKRIKYVQLPDLYQSVKDYASISKRKEMASFIEEEVKQSDLVIVRSVASYACKQVIESAKKYRKPYMIEVTGIAWRSLWFHDWKGKLLTPFVEHDTRKYIKNSPYAIYVTEQELQRLYPCKGQTTGVSDVEIRELDQQILDKRLERMKNPGDTIVLGTIANVNVKAKGHKYVFKAMQKLKKQGKQYEYQLAGGGDKTRLERLARKYGVSENVKFLGAIPHEDIFKWLDTIDIYIQPSFQEGLPRAMVEAMSRACPCIGSDVGGNRELLNEKYIFRTYHTGELCKCIAAMDQDEQRKEAVRSFEQAKRYQKEVLDLRRAEFYKKFLEAAGVNNTSKEKM